MQRKLINIYTIRKFEYLKKIIKILAIIFTTWLLYKIISAIPLTTIAQTINDKLESQTPGEAMDIIAFLMPITVLIIQIIIVIIEALKGNLNESKHSEYL